MRKLAVALLVMLVTPPAWAALPTNGGGVQLVDFDDDDWEDDDRDDRGRKKPKKPKKSKHTPVPEPGTAAMVMVGLVGIAALGGRRARK